MKAVVHLGLHKTATTAFQVVAARFRERLLSHGILYPNIEPMGPSHNLVAHNAMRGDFSIVSQICQASKQVLGSSGVLLLSAENLEGALCAQLDLSPIHSILASCFDEVEYVVVTRNPFDYFCSLYAEMSKWGCILSYTSCANQILSRKYLHLSSDQFEWGFCFETAEAIKTIMSRLEVDVKHFDYEAFVDGFPGRILLSNIIQDSTNNSGDTGCELLLKEIDQFCSTDANMRSINSRLSDYQVELNYAASCLGYDNQRIQQDNEARAITILLACKRLEARNLSQNLIRDRFEGTFGNVMA